MPLSLEKESEVVASSRLCEWGTSRAVRISRKMCDATGIAIGDSLDVRSGVDAGIRVPLWRLCFHSNNCACKFRGAGA